MRKSIQVICAALSTASCEYFEAFNPDLGYTEEREGWIDVDGRRYPLYSQSHREFDRPQFFAMVDGLRVYCGRERERCKSEIRRALDTPDEEH